MIDKTLSMFVSISSSQSFVSKFSQNRERDIRKFLKLHSSLSLSCFSVLRFYSSHLISAKISYEIYSTNAKIQKYLQTNRKTCREKY